MQADSSLHWALMSEGMFSYGADKIIFRNHLLDTIQHYGVKYFGILTFFRGD